MSDLVAALPMYDWAETRAETDSEWAVLREALLARGIDAPERLTRRNADMPAVPGGVRDATGAAIAPDPATLPPDELDLATLWRHPRLLFAQTCWGPLERGLEDHVGVVGQPDYSAHEGGEGTHYSSAVLMRRGPLFPGEAGRGGRQSPPRSPSRAMDDRPLYEGDVVAPPPSDARAVLPLDRLRGRRFAYNAPDSMSGLIALTRDLEAMGADLDIFAGRIETGGHRASVTAVAEGRADVCAVDCRTWALVRRFEPRARDVAVVGWTARREGLPYVSARALGALHGAIHEALARLS